jgi:hypothetical protein
MLAFNSDCLPKSCLRTTLYVPYSLIFTEKSTGGRVGWWLGGATTTSLFLVNKSNNVFLS